MKNDDNLSEMLKFRYCEKATKFEKKFPMCFDINSNVKTSGRFFSNSVAFSQYLNFGISLRLSSFFMKLTLALSTSTMIDTY